MGNLMAKRKDQLTTEVRTKSKPIYEQIKECQCLLSAAGTSSTFNETKSTTEETTSPDGSIEVVVGHQSRCIIIPDDVWLHIFSYLSLENLCMVEKVCDRWKQLVDVHLKSRRQLTIESSSRLIILPTDVLSVLNRCGLKLRQLTIRDGNYYLIENLLKTIGDRCPNVVSVSVLGATKVDIDGLQSMCVSCNKLQYLDMFVLSLPYPLFNRENLQFLLKSMKHLKRLRTNCWYLMDRNDCLNHAGPMVEELELEILYGNVEPLVLDLGGNLKNLRKLTLKFWAILGNVVINGSSQDCVKLKELSLKPTRMNDELLIQISRLPCLEKLELLYYVYVDHTDYNVFRLYFHACPDLKGICLVGYDQLRMSRSKRNEIFHHCQQLLQLDLSHNNKVSDPSLAVRRCRSINDIGSVNLVIECHQLESLDIRRCCHFTEAIVAPSLEAVEGRREKRLLRLIVA